MGNYTPKKISRLNFFEKSGMKEILEIKIL